MRKILFIVVCIVMTFVLNSCGNQNELTSEDEKYVFILKDIRDLDLTEYKIKKLKNGRDYFYTKDENIIHGFYSLYGISYCTEDNKEIELSTNFSIHKSKNGAIKLFDGYIRTLKIMDKENLYKLKAQDYEVDQIYLYSTEDQTIITLQKDNLFIKSNKKRRATAPGLKSRCH